MFKTFRRKHTIDDPVERLLKPTFDMIYNLDRAEFNRWLEGAKLEFESIQKFRKVKTIDEKENGDPDIDQAERILAKESKKKEVK